MDSGALAFAIGKTLISIVAVFLLREKWPHKYSIGFALCLFAPAWGQIYVESCWMTINDSDRYPLAATSKNVRGSVNL